MLYDEAKRPTFPTCRGSILLNNIIVSRDTKSFSGFSSGIQLSGGSELVACNYVITPTSSRFYGILARKEDSLIYRNLIGAVAIVRESRYSDNRSVGEV